MTATISVTEEDLREATRQWLVLVAAGEIVSGQDNRVSMPTGDFIVLTTLRFTRQATNESDWTRPTAPTGPGEENNRQSTEWTCQIDVYGANAADTANMIQILARSSWACEQFSQVLMDAAPMYASDPIQTSMINGEEQYESRYTLELHVNYNPVVSTPLDFADTLSIGLVNVDATFPPLEN